MDERLGEAVEVVFQRLRAAFGAGVVVDTVLDEETAAPGGVLRGEIRMTGGGTDYEIEGINLELQAKTVVETSEGTYRRTMSLHRVRVVENAFLPAQAQQAERFEFTLPWGTPLSTTGRSAVPGITLGIATELELARAMDKSDLDPIRISPIPAQRQVLDVLAELGFELNRAALKDGQLDGSTANYYQELGFYPGKLFRETFDRLEISFITRATQMDILFEINERGRLRGVPFEALGHLTIDYGQLGSTPWKEVILQKLKALA